MREGNGVHSPRSLVIGLCWQIFLPSYLCAMINIVFFFIRQGRQAFIFLFLSWFLEVVGKIVKISRYIPDRNVRSYLQVWRVRKLSLSSRTSQQRNLLFLCAWVKNMTFLDGGCTTCLIHPDVCCMLVRCFTQVLRSVLGCEDQLSSFLICDRVAWKVFSVNIVSARISIFHYFLLF